MRLQTPSGFFPRSGAPQFAFLSLARSFGLQTQQTDLQGVVLLVSCIKLLGNYHLQLLVFCLCFACVLHQAIGEVPFAGSYFACVLHQAIGEPPFAGSCFACVLHQAIGELPFAGSCFVCVLHQVVGELPFAGSCFACVLHQAIEEVPFAGSCFACVLHQASWGTTICRVWFRI